MARFEREARAISRLHHRHCVSILDFGVYRRTQPYIVMEYVDGRPLNEADMGTLTPARAVRIMRQILPGLPHAHSRGVVHRDLKPENVMLVETTGIEDFVKILDFGLARIISVDEPTLSLHRRDGGGHAELHVAGAGARQDGRSPHRHLLGRRDPLRLCDGEAPSRRCATELLRMHVNGRRRRRARWRRKSASARSSSA